ncbi:MAG: VOC family protein [Proteobacteria bacterium]|nr:VOC family protein [Pseudomonadota bacterium]
MTLKLILIITLCAPDLSVMEHAYTGVLHYSVVERGHIPAQLGKSWAAPKMSGHPYLMLRPESNANIYIRVIQGDVPADYEPMSTYGWNATEFLVQDPDALAEAIRKPGSGFTVAGEPRPLGPNSPIRAMQAIGPAHEVLYLTRPPEGGAMETAHTPVDRPFIVILGNRDLPATQAFLQSTFGLSSGTPIAARMTVLNKAFGLDIETTHPLTVARVSPQYSIELDQYPDVARERPHAKGALPPALAMVSFETESLESVKDKLLAPPQRIKRAPYDGRRTGTLRGPSGELIELIEDARHNER